MPLPVTGLNFERTADLWIKFMGQLGYERFAAGGLSWGQLIAAQLGHKYPDHMIGLHMSGTLPLTMMSGFPGADEYAPDEMERLERMNKGLQHGSSHAAVHTVEPQNVSYAMHDSPVALLAWLVNRRYWWGDHGGRIEERFSKDDLITNAMLYWVNESFVNTVRFYWEGANHLWKPAHANVPQVATPTAIAIAPADVVYMPRNWMETFYNLKQLTFMESGGHFAAMEEPEAVVADIQKFFRGLRSGPPQT
jgi:pimeloyl-ACP methyl ester carboxylesterase